MGTDMDTGEGKRGTLKLSQLLQLMLMPKLTLIPGIATMDMVLDIMVTTADLTMAVTTGHTDMDTGEEKRGKLKLSQLLQLMLMPKLTPIPGIATMDMVLVTMVTTADPTMVATTGPMDTVMDTTGHMDMDTEAMDIGARMSRPSNQ